MLEATWKRITSLIATVTRLPVQNDLPPRRLLPPQVNTVPLWLRSLAMCMGTCREMASGFIVFTSNMLSRHALVLGTTGCGKTVFCVELFFNFVVRGMKGGAYIDPKGDAIDDLLAKIHKQIRTTNCDAILKRIHVLTISPECVFGFDAFHYEPDSDIAPEHRETAYISWLHRKVDSVIELIFRVFNESEDGKPRLRRILRIVFIATGTAIDDHGRHLPLSESMVLLDVFHPRHDEIYARVEPHLPADVRSEFIVLRELRKRPQDYLGQAESSLNRFRNWLTPLIRAIFSQTVDALDFPEFIRGHHIALVDVSESKYVSRAQANAVGDLIIQEIVEAAASMPRKQRRHFYLFIDEAHFFCGPTLDRVLRMGRGWLLCLVLISQNLRSFYRNEENDYRETVLSEPQTKVIFQQQVLDDDLVTNLGVPNLDFTKHTVEADRHNGFEYLPTLSVGNSASEQRGHQRGSSVARNHGITRSSGLTLSMANGATVGFGENQTSESSQQYSEGETSELKYGQQQSLANSFSQQRSENTSFGVEVSNTEGHDVGVSSTTTKTDTETSTNTQSENNNDTTSRRSGRSSSANGSQWTDAVDAVSESGRSNTQAMQHGQSNSNGETASATHKQSVTNSNSVQQGTTQSLGQAATATNSQQWGNAVSLSSTDSQGVKNARGVSRTLQQSSQNGAAFSGSTAHSIGATVGDNWGTSTASTTGQNRSVTLSPVAMVRTELQEQPQLRTSVEDQLWRLKQTLVTLGNAECLVRLFGVQKTLPMKVLDCQSPYVGDEFFEVVDEMRRRIRASHPYNFRPDLSVDAENRRIDEYVGIDRDPAISPESAGGAFDV